MEGGDCEINKRRGSKMSNESGTNMSDILGLGNALKGLDEIIETILEPRGLDSVMLKGHEKIVDKVVEGKQVSENEIAVVSNYKRIVKEYKNCKNAVENAKKYLREGAESKNVSGDWLDFYFDKVRLISDEVVQDIWSRILAEEVNKQGTISLSLLHSLSIMSKEQATIFSNIARFCMREYKGEKIHPLIFLSTNVDAYENSGITHKNLRQLERLGLIDYNKKEYVFKRKKILVSGNHVITVYGDPDKKNKIKAGNVIFTDDGMTLYSIVSDTLIKNRLNIMEFTAAKFKARNCRVLINGKEF